MKIVITDEEIVNRAHIGRLQALLAESGAKHVSSGRLWKAAPYDPHLYTHEIEAWFQSSEWTGLQPERDPHSKSETMNPRLLPTIG